MCRFGEKNVLNHCRSPHAFRLSPIAYVMLDEYLYLMQWFFNAVFQPLRNFAAEIKAMTLKDITN